MNPSMTASKDPAPLTQQQKFRDAMMTLFIVPRVWRPKYKMKLEFSLTAPEWAELEAITETEALANIRIFNIAGKYRSSVRGLRLKITKNS